MATTGSMNRSKKMKPSDFEDAGQGNHCKLLQREKSVAHNIFDKNNEMITDSNTRVLSSVWSDQEDFGRSINLCSISPIAISPVSTLLKQPPALTSLSSRCSVPVLSTSRSCVSSSFKTNQFVPFTSSVSSTELSPFQQSISSVVPSITNQLPVSHLIPDALPVFLDEPISVALPNSSVIVPSTDFTPVPTGCELSFMSNVSSIVTSPVLGSISSSIPVFVPSSFSKSEPPSVTVFDSSTISSVVSSTVFTSVPVTIGFPVVSNENSSIAETVSPTVPTSLSVPVLTPEPLLVTLPDPSVVSSVYPLTVLSPVPTANELSAIPSISSTEMSLVVEKTASKIPLITVPSTISRAEPLPVMLHGSSVVPSTILSPVPSESSSNVSSSEISPVKETMSSVVCETVPSVSIAEPLSIISPEYLVVPCVPTTKAVPGISNIPSYEIPSVEETIPSAIPITVSFVPSTISTSGPDLPDVSTTASTKVLPFQKNLSSTDLSSDSVDKTIPSASLVSTSTELLPVIEMVSSEVPSTVSPSQISSQPDTSNTSSHSQDSLAEIFEAKFSINDLPLPVRFHVMREGIHFNSRIKDFSGASVSLRGKYISPEENLLVSKVDQPVHFFLQGPKQCVIDGIQMIENLIYEALEKDILKEVRETKFGTNSERLQVSLLLEVSRKDCLISKIEAVLKVLKKMLSFQIKTITNDHVKIKISQIAQIADCIRLSGNSSETLKEQKDDVKTVIKLLETVLRTFSKTYLLMFLPIVNLLKQTLDLPDCLLSAGLQQSKTLADSVESVRKKTKFDNGTLRREEIIRVLLTADKEENKTNKLKNKSENQNIPQSKQEQQNRSQLYLTLAGKQGNEKMECDDNSNVQVKVSSSKPELQVNVSTPESCQVNNANNQNENVPKNCHETSSQAENLTSLSKTLYKEKRVSNKHLIITSILQRLLSSLQSCSGLHLNKLIISIKVQLMCYMNSFSNEIPERELSVMQSLLRLLERFLAGFSTIKKEIFLDKLITNVILLKMLLLNDQSDSHNFGREKESNQVSSSTSRVQLLTEGESKQNMKTIEKTNTSKLQNTALVMEQLNLLNNKSCDLKSSKGQSSCQKHTMTESIIQQSNYEIENQKTIINANTIHLSTVNPENSSNHKFTAMTSSQNETLEENKLAVQNGTSSSCYESFKPENNSKPIPTIDNTLYRIIEQDKIQNIAAATSIDILSLSSEDQKYTIDKTKDFSLNNGKQHKLPVKDSKPFLCSKNPLIPSVLVSAPISVSIQKPISLAAQQSIQKHESGIINNFTPLHSEMSPQENIVNEKSTEITTLQQSTQNNKQQNNNKPSKYDSPQCEKSLNESCSVNLKENLTQSCIQKLTQNNHKQTMLIQSYGNISLSLENSQTKDSIPIRNYIQKYNEKQNNKDEKSGDTSSNFVYPKCDGSSVDMTNERSNLRSSTLEDPTLTIRKVENTNNKSNTENSKLEITLEQTLLKGKSLTNVSQENTNKTAVGDSNILSISKNPENKRSCYKSSTDKSSFDSLFKENTKQKYSAEHLVSPLISEETLNKLDTAEPVRKKTKFENGIIEVTDILPNNNKDKSIINELQGLTENLTKIPSSLVIAGQQENKNDPQTNSDDQFRSPHDSLLTGSQESKKNEYKNNSYKHVEVKPSKPELQIDVSSSCKQTCSLSQEKIFKNKALAEQISTTMKPSTKHNRVSNQISTEKSSYENLCKNKNGQNKAVPKQSNTSLVSRNPESQNQNKAVVEERNTQLTSRNSKHEKSLHLVPQVNDSKNKTETEQSNSLVVARSPENTKNTNLIMTKRRSSLSNISQEKETQSQAVTERSNTTSVSRNPVNTRNSSYVSTEKICLKNLSHENNNQCKTVVGHHKISTFSRNSDDPQEMKSKNMDLVQEINTSLVSTNLESHENEIQNKAVVKERNINQKRNLNGVLTDRSSLDDVPVDSKQNNAVVEHLKIESIFRNPRHEKKLNVIKTMRRSILTNLCQENYKQNKAEVELSSTSSISERERSSNESFARNCLDSMAQENKKQKVDAKHINTQSIRDNTVHELRSTQVPSSFGNISQEIYNKVPVKSQLINLEGKEQTIQSHESSDITDQKSSKNEKSESSQDNKRLIKISFKQRSNQTNTQSKSNTSEQIDSNQQYCAGLVLNSQDKNVNSVNNSLQSAQSSQNSPFVCTTHKLSNVPLVKQPKLQDKEHSTEPQLVHVTKSLLEGMEMLKSLSNSKEEQITTLPAAELTQLINQMKQVTELLQTQRDKATEPEPHSVDLTTSQAQRNSNGDSELQKSTIILGDKEKEIVLIDDDKSVYASLAYLFKDKICTKATLSSAAEEFHEEAFSFIKNNKDIFINKVNKIYKVVFPRHTLDPETAFKSCCTYLAHSNNYRFHEPIRAIATIYRTPVLVSYEDGRRSELIEPIFESGNPPECIICRGKFQYVPVVQSNSLLIGTWNVINEKDPISSEKLKMIDECLEKHKVDVACLQCCVSWSAFCGISTDNYSLWCSGMSQKNSGIVFMVRKKSSVTLSGFTPHFCNLASADLTFRNKRYRIIGVDFSDYKNNKQLTKVLPEVIRQASRSSQVVLLGEFNAMIGISSLAENVKLLIDTDLHEYCNEIRTFLENLAIYYNFKIVTTFSDENALLDSTGEQLLKKSKKGGSRILVKEKADQLCKRFVWQEEEVSEHAILATSLTFTPVDHDCEILENFKVATWHVGDCSLSSQRKNIDICLLQCNIDLVCIQETKMGVLGQLSTENYNWWCSQEAPSPFNIALLLRKGCGATLTDFKSFSNGVVSAIVTVGKSRYAVFGCYLPPCSLTQYRKTYMDLRKALHRAPLSARILLLGDFSAFLGSTGQYFTTSTHQSPSLANSVTSNDNASFMNGLIHRYNLFICSHYQVPPEIACESQTCHILLHKGDELNRKGEAENYNVESFKQGLLVTYNIPKECFYVK